MFSSIHVATVLAICALVGAADQCPQGWHHFQGDIICIKGYDATKAFYDARSTCQAQGADLVKITDDAKKTFVLGLHKIHFWMGAWDPDKLRKWAFIADGTPVTNYHPWNRGKPNNWQNNEYCVNVYAGDSDWKKGVWNDGNCYTEYTFVCEKAPEALPTGTCNPGWHYFAPENTCIKGHDMERSYFQAVQDCQALNGELIQLKDAAKADFVLGIQTSGMFWNGIKAKDGTRDWTYIDGSSLGSYKPWSRGEPNNWGSSEDCVTVYTEGSRIGRWNDDGCGKKFRVVCESPASGNAKVYGLCPAEYTRYEGDGKCLRKYSGVKSWQGARKVCRREGGDLVMIKTRARAKQNFAKQTFWLGLSDVMGDGKTWHYVDGSPLGLFKGWNSGEPDDRNGRKYCVRVYNKNNYLKDKQMAGTWGDYPCYFANSYVCEKDWP